MKIRVTALSLKEDSNSGGLNDKSIFYEDGQQKMLQNYRNAFLRLSMYYLDTNTKNKGK